MGDRPAAPFEAVAAFHGHICPGLAMGYRMAAEAVRHLPQGRAVDEELVAVVENDACGVDALQYLTGCTFGKGNLIFRDYGKQVYTLYHRPSGRAVRVSLADSPALQARRSAPGDQRQQMVEWLLDAPAAEVVRVMEVDGAPPEEAHIRRSVTCSRCGERVMETRARIWDGSACCIPCFDGALAQSA